MKSDAADFASLSSYPLYIDPITNDFVFEAISGVDEPGIYLFDVFVTAIPNTFTENFFVTVPMQISIQVLEAKARVTLDEVVSIIESTLVTEADLPQTEPLEI